MQFSTQAATILAILCLSAPALATMVNGIPILVPEAVGIEARDPSFISGATEALDGFAHVGNSLGDALNAGDNVVNAGKNLFGDAFPTPTPFQ
jgi:hypothetical protein